MSKRACAILLVAWLFSLATVATIAQPRVVTSPQLEPGPGIISGNDIGFRVEGHQGSRPIGTLVIRVNGEWVEPKSVLRIIPLGSR
jgi:hypothetical protein